jgi:CRP/FNR family cyclic AMP-dependent transcriptional regulator
MNPKSIGDLLSAHAFFRDLPKEDTEYIAGCGINKVFKAGDWIAREGDPADTFYILRSGRAAIITHIPQRGEIVVQTVSGDDIVGWSWLFAPYQWTFGIRALDTVHAIELNGKCLREKCEQDTAMGYRLMKKFVEFMTSRLRATRIQLLDIYGSNSAKEKWR